MASTVYGTRLLVRDFGTMYRFYHDVLGLAPRSGAGEPPYIELFGGEQFVALFERVRMAEALPGGLRESPGGDMVLLGFEVENVDREEQRLRGLGIELLAPPTDRPAWHLRTLHLRDPEGNLVELFQNTADRPPTTTPP